MKYIKIYSKKIFKVLKKVWWKKYITNIKNMKCIKKILENINKYKNIKKKY